MSRQTTLDQFLGGRLVIEQPAKGYRAGADPVFLAAATQAVPGNSVLELGAGVGIAVLCLKMRVDDLSVTAVERNPDAAELAARNAKRAGAEVDIVTSDLRSLPKPLKEMTFDHVVMNPPFFDRTRGTSAPDPGREAGRGSQTPLEDWIDIGLRRLAPKGRLTAVWTAERLPEFLALLHGRAGGVHIKPLAPRHGRPAELVLLTMRKGSRAPARLLSPLVLHEGDAHTADRDSYTEGARRVLRDGQALNWT